MTISKKAILEDKVVSEIRMTTNYAKFQFHLLNRDVNENQCKVIAQSISNKDYKDDTPILVKYVSGKLIILDGQHRFTERMRLGLPVYYKVANHVDIHDVPNLNGTNKKWDLADYVDSYAKSGNQNYINLVKFVEKFSDLGDNREPMAMGSAIRIMGYHDRGSQIVTDANTRSNANVKAGNFIYPTTADHHTDAKNICDLAEYFGKGFHRNIVSAYLTYLKPTDGYDHDRMLKNLEREFNNKGGYIVMPSKGKDFAELLNRIYNANYKASSRIRFSKLD